MAQTTPSVPMGTRVTPITPATESLERKTINRVVWRLMPILMPGRCCACLERVC